jgi:quinol monooxygenase YgiN
VLLADHLFRCTHPAVRPRFACEAQVTFLYHPTPSRLATVSFTSPSKMTALSGPVAPAFLAPTPLIHARTRQLSNAAALSPQGRRAMTRGTVATATPTPGPWPRPRPQQQPSQPSQQQQQQAATPSIHLKPVVRAPVVDSRIGSAVEAHHWITVSSSSVRLFERAAVAHTDMVRRVERHAQNGSIHRWVLRAVADPALATPLQSSNAQSRYVVMETFKPGEDNSRGVMRRWLGAVERLGPALNAPVVQTLQYNNVFTSKLHNAKFDINDAVVIVESVNAGSMDCAEELQNLLEANAEASVACGDCLEFCVLEAVDSPAFYKTIEVYADVDRLHQHMEGNDASFLEKIAPFAVRSAHRSRSAFKPVVFA